MSIKSHFRIVNRLDLIVEELQKKYAHNKNASLELKKLHESLKRLENYLHSLDQIKPDYSTNDINSFMNEINLHVDILKVEIAQRDYKRLNNAAKAVRKILNFHPTKYTFITFVLAWIYEMIYFI